MMMTDDEWWWTHLERKRMFVRWWGDVKKSLKRSSYNTKCRIFHHTKIYKIYRIYRIYKIYKIYNIFYRSFFYIHCNIYMFHDFCSLIAQNLASALWCGVQTCTILLHCTCWEPWQTKSSLSALMRGSDNALVGPTQIMTRW